jgi:diadenosine tetraphosphate (Ap4A) HIT family hydrolase
LPTAIHRRVDALRSGTEPTCIARLASGWAVMGDPQLLPGYCLLLPDPVVGHLNELRGGGRARFLADVAALGDAVLEATGALRINYAVFGNLEPALHAHVIPRYANEPEGQRTLQPWALDWTQAPGFDPLAHGDLRRRIHAALGRAGRIGAPGSTP